MNIGKQSTLNDLESIAKKTDDLNIVASAAKQKADEAFTQAKLSRGAVNIGTLSGVEAKLNSINEAGFYFADGGYTIIGDEMDAPPVYSPAFMCVVGSDDTKGRVVQTVTPYDQDKVFSRRFSVEKNWGNWFEYLTSVNTITDSNGFIKAA